MSSTITVISCFAFCLFSTVVIGAPAWQAKDLNPVTLKTAPKHAPLVLVKDGKPMASIVVMKNAAAAQSLQNYIAAATGAKLPIVQGKQGKIDGRAIVLGDCRQAAALGLIGDKMPPEGFAIKTTKDRVFIVGNNAGRGAHGGAWGAYEFLERFVGMRWYFPPATEKGPQIGLSIPNTRDLIVPPVWLEDAPVFRMRVIWPPIRVECVCRRLCAWSCLVPVGCVFHRLRSCSLLRPPGSRSLCTWCMW